MSIDQSAPSLLQIGRRRSIATAKACCDDGTDSGAGAGAPVISLVGAPNCGKSTLFNALTGAKVTMGNWPGTTVTVARGTWHTTALDLESSCHDAPGSVSGDDQCHCSDHEHVDGRTAARQDMTLIDLPGSYSLDPVSPDEALTRELLVDGPADERPDVTIVLCDAAHLARSLYIVTQLRERAMKVVVALSMLDVAANRGIEVDTFALSKELGCPVVGLDPRRRRGADNLAAVVHDALEGPTPEPRALLAVPDPGLDVLEADLVREDERFSFLDRAVAAGTRNTGEARVSMSDKVDRWVTAPVAGPLIFMAVMWLVFQVTTTVAAPLQGALDDFFSGPVSDAAHWLLVRMGLGTSWVNGLVVNGLVAGVGMLLTFAPLMALMFLLLALLEDSGYMARAAVVTDRMMRRIGLPGRAFLPLVVGFGCNVPAISATRTLPNPRQRLLTALLVPFTSCSARLTVYVLVATTFFGRSAGTVVFAMYLLSIVFVIAVGFLLRKTLWRTMGDEPLVLDLPPYQRPTARLTASVTWVRLKGFLHTASGIIVATVCLVWLLQSIPTQPGDRFGEVPVGDSAYGVAAKTISPVFEPAGFDTWQTTSALVVGFVAKEAVVSSWAQTYATDEPADNHSPGTLGTQIRQAFEQSSGGHPIPAVMAFLVFLLAYTPCVATLAAQKREIGLRWTLFGISMQLVTAWVSAVAVFQIGRLFW